MNQKIRIQTKLRDVGNTYGITIPKEKIRAAGLKRGHHYEVTASFREVDALGNYTENLNNESLESSRTTLPYLSDLNFDSQFMQKERAIF